MRGRQLTRTDDGTRSGDERRRLREFATKSRPNAPPIVPMDIDALTRPWGALDMQSDRTIFDLADWLTDPPSGGPIQMWFVGAGLSAIVGFYGLSCCFAQRAVTLNITSRGYQPLGPGLLVEITGVHAVTFGLLVACIGLFIHFQWFWGNHKRLLAFYEIGKYAAVMGVVAAMIAHGYVMFAYT